MITKIPVTSFRKDFRYLPAGIYLLKFNFRGPEVASLNPQMTVWYRENLR